MLRFVFALFAMLVGVLANAQVLDPRLKIESKYAPFYHGVASGDPLEDRVIIWTRVSPLNALAKEALVKWRIATDPELEHLVQEGEFLTGEFRDFTVKVDVKGLKPGTTYYYDFECEGRKSITGRTKTTPAGNNISELRFGVVSCSNYEYGYFNAYRDMVNRNDLDAIIHLGDYIYEYELGGYSSDISMRSAVPEQELISLDNYRLRHSHYKLDPDLRALHQQYAFLSIWDDHESSDNAYKDGAYNHQANEGSWQERKAAAVKAYMEWMPVRENPEFDQRIYRKFSYGKLVDLYMLDTRLEGRDEQVAIGSPDISSAERRLLGDEQFNWLRQEMLSSKAQWKVLAQQVMMAPLRIGGLSINTDQWDGYTFERDRLFAFWQKEKMENLVVLTGDIHSSWASDLPTKAYNPVKDTGSVGVEFVCTSVTSPGMEIPVAEQALLLNNPHLKFSNLSKRGYMVLVIDSLRAQAEWYFSETVLEKNSRHQFGKAFYAEKGKPFLKESKRESIPKASQIALAPNEPQGGFSNLEEEYVFTVFGLYPNPFSSSFQMQFFSSTSTPAVLRMYSDNGAEIKRIKIAPHIGVNYLEVKTQELPSGFYTISLEIAGEIKGYSLIKK